MSQIPILEPFDCEGDPSSLGSRWDKWKRGLDIYFQAVNICDSERKRATLLHTGGLALQDVYFNIPGARVEASGTVDVYEVAIQKLNEYFAPKQSSLYERHVFRLMRQEQGEKFEKFLMRLHRQGAKCNFSNKNENLIDQITEKCLSTELRKRILLLGDTVTVDKIVVEANAMETVERQLSDFQEKGNYNINKIDNKSSLNKPMECTRCGSKAHKFDSTLCAAKDKICAKCGFKGHFHKMCRTRANKRKAHPTKTKPTTKRLHFNTDYAASSKKSGVEPDSSIDYIFNVDDDATIQCQLGGVLVDMVIDSGSKCNIISENTWIYLKSKNVSL